MTLTRSISLKGAYTALNVALWLIVLLGFATFVGAFGAMLAHGALR